MIQDMTLTRVQSNRVHALPFAVMALVILAGFALAGCATVDSTGIALAAHQEAIAREVGPLETAATRQGGPLVAEYLSNADALEPEYRFPGTRVLGMVDCESCRLGCVLLLGPASPPRGTIVALHGYNAYSAFNLSALYRLAENGWAVVAVDLPGHGNSSGTRGYIGDFSEYADSVRDIVRWIGDQKAYDLPRPLVLLGHSTGGAAALETLWDHPEGIDRAVLVAPLIEPRHFTLTSTIARVSSAFSPYGPIPGAKQGYLCFDRMPFEWVKALARWRSGLKMRPAIDIPILVVQGDADRSVDCNANLRAISAIAPKAEVQVLTGRGHVLLDRSDAQEETLAAVESFLDDGIRLSRTAKSP